MIEIKNLNVFYKDKKLLRELDFAMSEGKFIGITGASGSGKSLFAKSLIRLFDDDFRVRADKFSIYKKDILKLSQNELKEHRKKVAALIFQNSVASLHPLFFTPILVAIIKQIKSLHLLILGSLGWVMPISSGTNTHTS